MEERIASHGLPWSSLDKRFDGVTRGYSTPLPIYITLRGATAAMLNGDDSLRLESIRMGYRIGLRLRGQVTVCGRVS